MAYSDSHQRSRGLGPLILLKYMRITLVLQGLRSGLLTQQLKLPAVLVHTAAY